jgi:hypothetical protein
MPRGMRRETRRPKVDGVAAGLYEGGFDRQSNYKFSEIGSPYPQIKPFPQGNLDAFCGIYTLINAVNVAAKAPVIDHGAARVIFRELSAIAMSLRTDSEQTFRGLTGNHLRLLAHAMSSGLAEVDIDVQLLKPQHAFPALDIATARKSDWFRAAIEAPNTALILRINTKLVSHWSVLCSYHGAKIGLFDSAAINECANRSCTIWGVIKIKKME